MNNKTNIGLTDFAKKLLDQSYWYGTYVNPCTESRLQGKTKQYPNHYTTDRMPTYRKHIAAGKICTDCVGLIKGYCWTKDDGTVGYNINGCPDTSANGMYNAAKVKGAIKTIPETPGLCVRYSGHIGVYIGNGEVIEARGFAYGVVKTQLKDRPWTHWLECPYITYEHAQDIMTTPNNPAILGDRVLKKGMKGTDVKALQELLITASYPLIQYGADSDFGLETELAVKTFQSAMKLNVDGVVGEKTLRALIDQATASEITDISEEPTSTPTVAGKWIVTGGTVNVRSGPGTQYNIATQVKKNDMLDAVPVEGWMPVLIGGNVLWISEKYLSRK